RLSFGPKYASLDATTTPPCSSAARSNGLPDALSAARSGAASPCTLSRATPPSGKIRSRRRVQRVREATAKRVREPPASRDVGRISVQAAPSKLACAPAREQASTAQYSGKLPVKNEVSTSSPCTRPGSPSRTTHQSCAPGVRLRLRRDSQPSIHLPNSVYL